MNIRQFEQAFKIAQRDAEMREAAVMDDLYTVMYDRINNWFIFLSKPDTDGNINSFTVSISHNAIVG